MRPTVVTTVCLCAGAVGAGGGFPGALGGFPGTLGGFPGGVVNGLVPAGTAVGARGDGKGHNIEVTPVEVWTSLGHITSKLCSQLVSVTHVETHMDVPDVDWVKGFTGVIRDSCRCTLGCIFTTLPIQS